MLKRKFSYLTYHHRDQLKLTQEALAEKVDISVRSVQYIERGDFIPKSETMLKLMIVLQIHPNELAKEVGIDVPLSPDNNKDKR